MNSPARYLVVSLVALRRVMGTALWIGMHGTWCGADLIKTWGLEGKDVGSHLCIAISHITIPIHLMVQFSPPSYLSSYIISELSALYHNSIPPP